MSKRIRKPVQKLGDYDDSSSIGGGGGGGDSPRSSSKRAGRANKKRDDRSALVEIWMCKNESGNKPSPELKSQYAEVGSLCENRNGDDIKS